MLKRGNKSKLWNGTRYCQMLVLVTSLMVILVLLVLFFHNHGEKLSSSNGLPKQKWNSFESLVQFRPTVEFRNGTDVIWQMPNSPKAVLFLAHGCDGKAINFWDKSPSCGNCVGLPEERLIALHSLSRGFAVLTISSAGRCWSLKEERLIVRDIIRWWVEKKNLKNLPLVALGASSGGYFVSVLATNLRFNSIILMIAEGMFDQIDVTDDYPPTLFVHMPKDLTRLHKMREYIELLRNRGIDVAEIKCMEFPLSPTMLADRLPGVDQTVSVKLFELFRDKGFIDEHGYMRNDLYRKKNKNQLRI